MLSRQYNIMITHELKRPEVTGDIGDGCLYRNGGEIEAFLFDTISRFRIAEIGQDRIVFENGVVFKKSTKNDKRRELSDNEIKKIIKKWSES